MRVICPLTVRSMEAEGSDKMETGEEGTVQTAPESHTQHLTLDGKAVAAEIRRELAAQVAAERERDPTVSPGLTILQVGGREDSNVYIRMKTKAAQEVAQSPRLLSSLHSIAVESLSNYQSLPLSPPLSPGGYICAAYQAFSRCHRGNRPGKHTATEL